MAIVKQGNTTLNSGSKGDKGDKGSGAVKWNGILTNLLYYYK